ncbi:hypothetical protein M514_07277 [Trichuris suis]|uniref:Uncharacterized protein n=1 Tax=Trichuris suis TaxID=68888 RepID=A0A085M402_9BILA|nr:hypothetical protein M513_07277 [Trichuris suis]KFD63347.1 hypothetical protein M514_07277 [Trichuris suis]
MLRINCGSDRLVLWKQFEMYNTLTIPPDGEHSLSLMQFRRRSRGWILTKTQSLPPLFHGDVKAPSFVICDDLAEERAISGHSLTVSSEERTCGRNAPDFVTLTQLMWHP